MQAMVARQPVFDRNLKVEAYELLFRGEVFPAGDVASSSLLSDAFFGIGWKELVGDRPALINIPGELLCDDRLAVLPKGRVILELLETVEPEPAILEACRQLKAQGHRLGWDDFAGCADDHPFLKLVEWVKVDFWLVGDEERRRELAGWLKRQGIRPLAEKVETQAEFRNALAAGYELFQGYFLARPEIVEGKKIPGNKTHYYQLLAKVSADPLPMDEVEMLIRRDVSLTYKLLHVVNSAAFNRRQAVHSIRDALLILGEVQVRRWIMLLVMPALALDKPEELTTQAVLRARICELLSERADASEVSFEAFLAGMMSLVEALTGRRFATLAAELDLSERVRQAVGERVGSLSRLLQVVESQEEGDWAEVDRVCEELDLPPRAVTEACAESLRWYQKC